MMREVEEGAVIAMQPRPVAIPIGHHRAHVVVQHFARNSTEEVEGALVAPEQRLQPAIGDELDVSRPAPAQRRDLHRQQIAPAPDGREASLHLAPWLPSVPRQASGQVQSRATI
jgi:predicted nucleic acid-binding Zn ribbon protein